MTNSLEIFSRILADRKDMESGSITVALSLSSEPVEQELFNSVP